MKNNVNKLNAPMRLLKALQERPVPHKIIDIYLLIKRRKNSTRPEFYMPYNPEVYEAILANFDSLTAPEARDVIEKEDVHGAVQSLKDLLVRERLPFIVAYIQAPSCPSRYFLVEYTEGVILPEAAILAVEARIEDAY